MPMTCAADSHYRMIPQFVRSAVIADPNWYLQHQPADAVFRLA